jgi:hypothetical protein
MLELKRASRWAASVVVSLTVGASWPSAATGTEQSPARAPAEMAQAAPDRGRPDAPADPAGLNPVRRLEAEIEDYPAAPSAATDKPATRIPEVIEEQVSPAPGASAKRTGAPRARSEINAQEVEHVLGRSAKLVSLDALDAAQVTLLQQRLRERGFYLARIDGIAGPQTRAALEALVRERFEFGQRLLRQGQMTSELAELVGLQKPPALSPPGP